MQLEKLWVALATFAVSTANAATLHVPKEHKSIQAALNAAEAGDTILVDPGRYRERLRLKAGITLRSRGDDAPGAVGLKRAEATILDGGGNAGGDPGVVLAEGAVLDGFTITGVGSYDESAWKRHFDSQGEELGDEEGAAQAEGSVPAVRIQGVNCTVTHCIVHHNGDVGIAILGKEGAAIAPLIHANVVYRNMGGGIGVADTAAPIIRRNLCKENLRAGIGCRKANPIVLDNECVGNIRAGIGCREGARPVLRGNRCYRNRRAGIGIRMEGTAPIVESNECAENAMAGIGCRDGARPTLRDNVCRRNRLAGIGCRDGASPMILGNDCRENDMAGIGLRGKVSALIHGNRCQDNKLVAIGLDDRSTATITDNDLSRAGGQPPLLVVKAGSSATMERNRIRGGGVAAMLVQASAATLRYNRLTGAGALQGLAIWVRDGAEAVIVGNSVEDYRSAVHADGATVVVLGNTVRRARGTAFLIKNSAKPAHVHGNRLISTEEKAQVVEIQGPAGVVGDNLRTSEGAPSKPPESGN